ncbi:MAG: hypothetical protein UT13_C0001G0029 [Candidatus Pacebacteria bacterium GW2011_GWF2_38_9]|nr:MAG: hypothetical protein US01_C0001G0029 [candidate division TM6 bacterium GW2011_GWF2_28_16]KKQ07368.1 MAG: hypothetical protein US20_C0040G0004 [Candidatus Pacebacteria bacterium GW2011_GWF1_36_5]KKQ88383.1 MAG: hypothetical protein UT13_C0001G0029 [Candidatus Pacebacteria bacterium GW2011_GWF2_38_9]HAZ73000.1 hypothetical protein [Candidatus Paceibacterota bacterium]
MSDKVISSTTQEFLDVYDIVNDMVLLKDGTASMILQVGTMNFSLLAEQEQDAIIFTYGSLLNSLNYPIQISIQSQTKDVTKYLRLLDERISKASTDRKATLIKKYRDFVAALIKERNVLQKNFFVTIPASPAEMGLFTATSVLPGKTAFDINTVEKSVILEKAVNLLGPRRDHLTSQFGRLGLYVRQLNTQEIIQNFYINYNPEAAEGQEISSNENYTTPLVRASFGRKIMQVNDPSTQAQPLPINPADNSRPPAPVTPTEVILENPAVENVAPVAPPVPEASVVQETELKIQAPTPIQETTPVVAPHEEPIFSPEEILSGKTPAEEQVLQENKVQEVQAPPIVPPTPDPILEQASSPVSTPVPEQTPISDLTQTPELDLNLDPSLINADPISETVTQEPTLEPIPVITQETAVAQETNDFAEEIKPLQNKFETAESVIESPIAVEEAQIQNQTQVAESTPTEPEEAQI